MLLALMAAANLAADVEKIAKLPGEPSIVSAAGVTTDEQAVLTLENGSAFEVDARKHRLVIVGGRDGDEASVAATIDLVRWLKTDAPATLRNAWIVSALPDARALDEASLLRWMTFEAPDVIADVTASPVQMSSPPPVAIASIPPPSARVMLTRFLNVARREPWSPIRTAIRTRLARDPIAMAKLLANRYPGTPSISYIPSVAWANTLTLAQITNDASLRTKVEQQTAPWRNGQDLFGSRIQLTSVAGTFVFGDLGARDVAANGVEAASKIKDGDVYEFGQGWTDDMFMATVVLARGGRIELASRMLLAYASRLQRPDGVFIHATNGPVAWGRGNGFAALGLVEALAAMSTADANRARLLDVYRRQMAAARRLQAPDGMWNEVLDEPGSYREESATAMLMTAMSRGIRAGWIEKSFLPVVDRAWRGVAAHVAEDGTIVDVCASTGAGPTKRYYLDRAAVTGADDRGGAMALMAAVELHTLRQAVPDGRLER